LPSIGMNMLLWTDRVGTQHFPIFDQIAAAGFDGVEIPLGPGDADLYRQMAKAIRNAGLRCTAVTAMDASNNPIDPDPAVRRRAVDDLQQTLDLCGILGAELLCGPFHSAFKVFAGRGPTDQEFEWSAEVVAAAADYARDMPLALEFLNRFECYLVNTATDTQRLVELVDRPNVGTLYDTHHAHIEIKDPVAEIKACRRSIRHIHISENDRGVPGSGQARIFETLEALHATDYDGWLTIEAFSRITPDFAAAIHIWRDFFANPDDVLHDGIRYIRDSWAKIAR
jgi:D-psicose/D-tagatose/L-ribulose 3-epimerase